MKKLIALMFATIILMQVTPAGAQNCRVQRGDTMYKIAKEYHVLFHELLKLNRHYPNQNLIHPNDKIELPDGSTGAGTTESGTGDTNTSNDETADGQASEQAQAVLKIVNEERAKQGLKALVLDKQLNNVAQLKAEDMKKNNYFDHNSPTLGSPFDLMRSQGVSYRTAGENIAAGQKTPEQVMESWMNSSGHRANILNKNYTQLGVGFCAGGSYDTYWVQEFTG